MIKKLEGCVDMTEWIVIDQFGNMIAQGFWTKEAAEQYSKIFLIQVVIQKNQLPLTTDSYEFVVF